MAGWLQRDPIARHEINKKCVSCRFKFAVGKFLAGGRETPTASAAFKFLGKVLLSHRIRPVSADKSAGGVANL